MITKERYIKLREYSDQGANLPPVNLAQMAEFEKKNNLMMHKDKIGYFRPNLEHLKQKKSHHLTSR